MPEVRPAKRRGPRRRLTAIARQWIGLLVVLMVVLFIGGVALIANGRGAPGRAVPDRRALPTTTTMPVAPVAPVGTAPRGKTKPNGSQPTAPVGIGTFPLSKLPPEAAQTWQLILKGGPFPNREDGVAYENRAAKLPPRPLGWYREYTVATPGTADRGPRRLVVGQDHSPFWSPDSDATFVFVDVAK